MNPTVALPGSLTWMGIGLSSGSRCPQSPKGLPLTLTQSVFCSYGRVVVEWPEATTRQLGFVLGLREENSAYSARLLLAWSQLLRTRHRCSRSTPLLRQLSPQVPYY